MSIGEGIGQGLLFAANNIAQNKRMKMQAEIENQQMAQRMQMQQQTQEAEAAREAERNLTTNQALLGLSGEALPEGYDQNQLRMVAPGIFQSALGKKEQAKIKQQELDTKKQQAKIRTQFAAQFDKATPEEQSALLADAENNGVDLLPFLQFQQTRNDKKTTLEENRAQKIADREDRQQFQAQQNQMYRRLASTIGSGRGSGGGGRGSGGSGGGSYKQTRDGQFIKTDKRGNPVGKPISAREAYNVGITNTPPQQRKVNAPRSGTASEVAALLGSVKPYGG